MDNLKVWFICLLVFFAGVMPAKDKAIIVTAVGSGTTRSEALHDAMRKAIVKAIGAYVSTKSTLKNSDFKEEVIVNSDATVTKYNEIEAVEHHGMWLVKIQAEILPNELLKYYPRSVSADISSEEIGNLLNKEVMFENVEKTLSQIFKNYYLHIYEFNKVGDMRLVGGNSKSKKGEVAFSIDYEAKINQNAYLTLQRKLCSLMDKICIQKGHCEVSSFNEDKTQYLRCINRIWANIIQLPTSEQSNYKFLVFKTFSGRTIKYQFYLIPKKILEIIMKDLLLDHNGPGQFSYLGNFFMQSNGSSLLKFYFKIYGLRFFYIDAPSSSLNYYKLHLFTFVNMISISSGGQDCKISKDYPRFPGFYDSLTVTLRFSLPRRVLSSLKGSYLYSLGKNVNNNDNIEEKNLRIQTHWRTKQ